jgi:hypothetical protein
MGCWQIQCSLNSLNRKGEWPGQEPKDSLQPTGRPFAGLAGAFKIFVTSQAPGLRPNTVASLTL